MVVELMVSRHIYYRAIPEMLSGPFNPRCSDMNIARQHHHVRRFKHRLKPAEFEMQIAEYLYSHNVNSNPAEEVAGFEVRAGKVSI